MPLHVSTRLDEAAVTYKIVSLDRNNNIKFNDQELGSHVSLREIGGFLVCLLHTAKSDKHTANSKGLTAYKHRQRAPLPCV